MKIEKIKTEITTKYYLKKWGYYYSPVFICTEDIKKAGYFRSYNAAKKFINANKLEQYEIIKIDL